MNEWSLLFYFFYTVLDLKVCAYLTQSCVQRFLLRGLTPVKVCTFSFFFKPEIIYSAGLQQQTELVPIFTFHIENK